MKTAGHTVLIAMKMEPGGYYQVTLECSCGKVFHRCNALPSEIESAKSLVLEQGKPVAEGHIARINGALQTLGVKQPCAA